MPPPLPLQWPTRFCLSVWTELRPELSFQVYSVGMVWKRSAMSHCSTNCMPIVYMFRGVITVYLYITKRPSPFAAFLKV